MIDVNKIYLICRATHTIANNDGSNHYILAKDSKLRDEITSKADSFGIKLPSSKFSFH